MGGPTLSEETIKQATTVMDLLTSAKMSLVTAESCSGGLVCTLLSGAEGAGTALEGGFVVYTKDQKAVALGVQRELLQKIGSVEPEIARRMAEGALERSLADIALVLTGVIGPAEDEDGNPVGRVIFGCGLRGEPVEVEECRFEPMKPDEMRNLVVSHALTLLERKIRQAAECGGRRLQRP